MQRKSKWPLRSIVEGILYVVKTGCQWRHLPAKYPPWITVYWYFNKWKNNGTIDCIYKMLHRMLRKASGRKESPSVGIIDSQSVRMTSIGNTDKGTDGYKKVKGRKRQIIVDTQGWLITAFVHAANLNDIDGGKLLLNHFYHEERKDYERLSVLYADQGYRGPIISELANQYGWKLDIVERHRSDGFIIKPKRWIVERTIAWFDNYRRLSKDYERLASSSEAMIKWAMTNLMANKLSKLT